VPEIKVEGLVLALGWEHPCLEEMQLKLCLPGGKEGGLATNNLKGSTALGCRATSVQLLKRHPSPSGDPG